METRASHGYFVGDEAAQQARDGELATGAMPPDPNSVVVANGDTGELTHTFERAGDLLMGCHIIGHYAAGMGRHDRRSLTGAAPRAPTVSSTISTRHRDPGRGAAARRARHDVRLVRRARGEDPEQAGGCRGLRAIELSRATFGTIPQNLFLAIGCNVAAIPLAALGPLNPIIAAAAMALSSVSVLGNSVRLRRFGG